MHTKNSRFSGAWRLGSTQHAAINTYQNVCPHFVIKASSMVSKQIGLQLKTENYVITGSKITQYVRNDLYQLTIT